MGCVMSVFQKIAFATACVSVALSGCANTDKSSGVVAQGFKKIDFEMDNKTKGLYYDTNTGLMWMRCPIGSALKQRTSETVVCDGRAVILSKSDVFTYIDQHVNAKNHNGYSDWRLPTVYEFEQMQTSVCKQTNQVETGQSVLTAEGRKPTYTSVYRVTYGQQGGYLQVADCADYDRLLIKKKLRELLEIESPANILYANLSIDNYHSDKILRVYSPQNQHSGWYGKVGIFGYRLFKDGDPYEYSPALILVRQHTPAKEAAK